jgi:hypothetical protein
VDFSLVANRATAPGAGGRTKMGEWSPRTAAVMSLLKEQLQSKVISFNY